MHERDGDRPQGDDGQDAHKGVDPYGRTSDTQLEKKGQDIDERRELEKNSAAPFRINLPSITFIKKKKYFN